MADLESLNRRILKYAEISAKVNNREVPKYNYMPDALRTEDKRELKQLNDILKAEKASMYIEIDTLPQELRQPYKDVLNAARGAQKKDRFEKYFANALKEMGGEAEKQAAEKSQKRDSLLMEFMKYTSKPEKETKEEKFKSRFMGKDKE
jgi:hypothetical protein